MYHEFVKKYQRYIVPVPSMSRDCTPTDNSGCERFIGTFKGFRMNEVILEDALKNKIKKNLGLWLQNM